MDEQKKRFISLILQHVDHLRGLVIKTVRVNVNMDYNQFANMLSQEYDKLENYFKEKYQKREV